MSKANVRMEVHKVNDKLSVIDIHGELNASAESALMDAYTRATSQGERTIVLNFKSLEYMNSSGIGLLVTLLIRARRQNQQLVASELGEHYQQIFEMTRLNEAIQIFPTTAEAVA